MRVIDTIDVIEGIDTIDFCCLDWDVVVVVAWLAFWTAGFLARFSPVEGLSQRGRVRVLHDPRIS